MSIVTPRRPPRDRRPPLQSQLPFGFDVDCYLNHVRPNSVRTSESQLPFGFDVDCYQGSDYFITLSGAPRLNCLSALMSIVTCIRGI